MLVLQQVGASISLLLGLIAVIFPKLIEKLVSIRVVDDIGMSEIRATYGGFFCGISLFALCTQESIAFVSLGVAWLSAALVRMGTLVFSNTIKKNIGGVIFEAIIGLLCLASLNTLTM